MLIQMFLFSFKNMLKFRSHMLHCFALLISSSSDPCKADRKHERQQAATTIQASWARFRQLKRQNMAMWMQAMVRYRLQRQEFLEEVHATKQIQRKWRIHCANRTAHQYVKDQEEPSVQQEPEEHEMPLDALEEEMQEKHEVNEACKVQEELPVQQEPEEQEMPDTQTLDAQEEEMQEKHEVNDACQVQEELPVQQQPGEQEMLATQTLAAQEEEMQEKHEVNDACQVQEELPVQQEPEDQEMPATQTLDAQEKEKDEVYEVCQVQEGPPVQQEPEEQEVPTLELQEQHENESCQVQEDLPVQQEPGEQELDRAISEHQKQQQAAAIIQASWTRARRRKMLSMAVWMQAMLRCRLQQQLFLQHCHAPHTLQKAAVSVADVEGVDVDCISNDSRDTTASEEESKVFKPKCDAWACAQCGLVNEVSPDICVLCEGPKPLRRSSLAQRARQRRAR